MPTAVSVANFEAAIGNCFDAITSEDWASAKKYYAQAEVMNAGLLLSVNDEGSQVTRRTALQAIKTALDAAEEAVSASGSENRFVQTRSAFGGGA